MVVSKTGGGVGTNQYQVRGHSRPVVVPAPPLASPVDPSSGYTLEGFDEPARLSIVRGATTVPDTLAQAALRDPLITVRTAAALNPNCPPEALWEVVAQRGNLGTMADAVARNPNTPTALLRRLARGADSKAAEILIQHPNLPIEEWDVLVDKSPKALNRAVSQDRCPAHILDKAAGSSNLSTLQTVAAHPNTAPATLSLLAGRAHDRVLKLGARTASMSQSDDPLPVLKAVARNEHARPETLETIRHWATKGWRRDYGGCTPKYMLYDVAANPNADPNTLRRIAMSAEDDGTRGALASNHHTPIDILSTLALDPNVQLRRRAAANPSVPPEVLIHLLTKSKDPQVRRAVLGNSQLPDHLRALAVLGR